MLKVIHYTSLLKSTLSCTSQQVRSFSCCVKLHKQKSTGFSSVLNVEMTILSQFLCSIMCINVYKLTKNICKWKTLKGRSCSVLCAAGAHCNTKCILLDTILWVRSREVRLLWLSYRVPALGYCCRIWENKQCRLLVLAPCLLNFAETECRI